MHNHNEYLSREQAFGITGQPNHRSYNIKIYYNMPWRGIYIYIYDVALFIYYYCVDYIWGFASAGQRCMEISEQDMDIGTQINV